MPDSFVPLPRTTGTFSVPDNKDNIKTITLDDGLVWSIQLASGQSVKRTEPASSINYLIAVLFPIIGFFVPWFTIRTLTWVAAGFFSR